VGKRKQRFTTPGFRSTASPEQAHWMREIGKSNAARPHTPKPRKGTRTERERLAFRQYDEGSKS
jgi:hypothetical protein